MITTAVLGTAGNGCDDTRGSADPWSTGDQAPETPTLAIGDTTWTVTEVVDARDGKFRFAVDNGAAADPTTRLRWRIQAGSEAFDLEHADLAIDNLEYVWIRANLPWPADEQLHLLLT